MLRREKEMEEEKEREKEKLIKDEAERVLRVETDRLAREQEEKRLREEMEQKEKFLQEQREREQKEQQILEEKERNNRQIQKNIIKKSLMNKSDIDGEKLYQYTKKILLQNIKFGENIIVSEKNNRYDITGYNKITIKISTPNKYRISLIKQEEQIDDIFHLSSRGGGHIIYNTHVNNIWGRETKKTYTLKSNTLIYEINTTKNNHVVNMNGHHFMTVPKIADANVLLVNRGDEITIN